MGGVSYIGQSSRCPRVCLRCLLQPVGVHSSTAVLDALRVCFTSKNAILASIPPLWAWHSAGVYFAGQLAKALEAVNNVQQAAQPRQKSSQETLPREIKLEQARIPGQKRPSTRPKEAGPQSSQCRPLPHTEYTSYFTLCL